MKLLPFLIVIFCAVSAHAAEAPLFYSRTTLVIRIKSPPEGASPTAAIDTELRDAQTAARTPGWYNFATLKEYKGALAAYAEPTDVIINKANEFAPVDVLFLDAYGIIAQIAPNLIPAELQEPVESVAPVLAMLYLKGGSCTKLGIKPGDTVQHKMFRKKPEVLTAPTAQPPQPALAPAPAPVMPVSQNPPMEKLN